ncbi:hypothetical protein ACFLRZ_04835, partial [Bacteroidota bacterium]
MNTDRTKGVYFVANDGVIELAIAFLNSFRKFNPEIPLCLIPFSSDITRLSKLQAIYNFTIYENPDFIKFCEKVSRQFHGRVFGHYMKLAIWQGPFDEFIYIDTDILVMRKIDF